MPDVGCHSWCAVWLLMRSADPGLVAKSSIASAVSRAGIIYVSDSELGWQPVVASWLQTRPEKEATVLKPCFDKFVDPLLDYIRCGGCGRSALGTPARDISLIIPSSSRAAFGGIPSIPSWSRADHGSGQQCPHEQMHLLTVPAG
jgi:hypothetical protein